MNEQARAKRVLLDFLPLLEGWYGKEMAELCGSKPWVGRGVLIALPVWGETYVNRFLDLCLPSMMSPRNLDVLRNQSRIVLFTSMQDYARVEAETWPLKNAGVDRVLRYIPPEILAAVNDHEFNKYWILGTSQNIGVAMARIASMGFHQGAPDHLYGERFFERLAVLGNSHTAICQTGITTNVAGVASEMWRYQTPDGSLAVPDSEFGVLSLRHMHAQTAACIMNDAERSDTGVLERVPPSHFLLWRGQKKIYLNCCHMNAVWLSPDLCDQAPSRIPATIDAELPSFIPGANFYVPSVDDGLSFIEASDDTKGSNGGLAPLEIWTRHCWEKVRFGKKWMPWFERTCEVAIPEQQDNFMSEEAIKADFDFLVAAMYRNRERQAYDFIDSLAFHA